MLSRTEQLFRFRTLKELLPLLVKNEVAHVTANLPIAKNVKVRSPTSCMPGCIFGEPFEIRSNRSIKYLGGK
jgi:hypothetical protein